jgi:hypothetical protein
LRCRLNWRPLSFPRAFQIIAAKGAGGGKLSDASVIAALLVGGLLASRQSPAACRLAVRSALGAIKRHRQNEAKRRKGAVADLNLSAEWLYEARVGAAKTAQLTPSCVLQKALAIHFTRRGVRRLGSGFPSTKCACCLFAVSATKFGDSSESRKITLDDAPNSPHVEFPVTLYNQYLVPVLLPPQLNQLNLQLRPTLSSWMLRLSSNVSAGTTNPPFISKWLSPI